MLQQYIVPAEAVLALTATMLFLQAFRTNLLQLGVLYGDTSHMARLARRSIQWLLGVLLMSSLVFLFFASQSPIWMAWGYVSIIVISWIAGRPY